MNCSLRVNAVKRLFCIFLLIFAGMSAGGDLFAAEWYYSTAAGNVGAAVDAALSRVLETAAAEAAEGAAGSGSGSPRQGPPEGSAEGPPEGSPEGSAEGSVEELTEATASLVEGWHVSVEREGEKEIRSLYLDGQLQGRELFFRDNGLLTGRERQDAGGTVTSRVEYAYDALGNPRALFIEAPGEAALGEAALGQASSGQAASGQGTSGQAASGQGAPRQGTGRDAARKSGGGSSPGAGAEGKPEGQLRPVEASDREDTEEAQAQGAIVSLPVQPAFNALPTVVLRQPSAAADPLSVTSTGRGGDWQITSHNSRSQPVKHVQLKDGETVSETLWERDEEGRIREKHVHQGQQHIRSIFDDNGHLIEEQIRYGSLMVARRLYSWENDNLVRVEERGSGQREVKTIDWNEGRKIRESFFLDGEKYRENRWESDEEKVETFFRSGEPVVRVYWEGSLKVREDFLNNGEVVRSRGQQP